MRITRITTTSSCPSGQDQPDDVRSLKPDDEGTTPQSNEHKPTSCGHCFTEEPANDDAARQSVQRRRQQAVTEAEPGPEMRRCRLSSSATLPIGAYNIEPMARKIREFVAGRQKRRLVLKNGECNVTNCNVLKRKRKYLVDIFTTLVDMKWRYHLIMFAAAFLISYCAFGLVWFLIAVVHRDTMDENAVNDTRQACVDNVYDYTTAVLFSVETQMTIGYGFRVITTECAFAIFVMMMQSCVGLFIQSLITGIIFAKISRPKGRSQTIMFSHKAVICKRDGQYNLLFRVGDMRKSHIIGTSIRALLVKNRLTSEGESIPLCQYPLTIETETSQTDSFVFLIWPVTVVHKINESSPLWDLSLDKLMTDHFEIIVLLEGTIESTGMLTQVRTSYIPMEIMWGERLVPLLTFQLQNGRYEIDYGQFHNTTPMSMPDCSAKEFAERPKTGITDELENPDSEYLVNFTAPAIRPASNNSRSLHALLSRKKLESGLSGEGGKTRSSSNLITSKKILENGKRKPWTDVSNAHAAPPPVYSPTTAFENYRNSHGTYLPRKRTVLSDGAAAPAGPSPAAVSSPAILASPADVPSPADLPSPDYVFSPAALPTPGNDDLSGFRQGLTPIEHGLSSTTQDIPLKIMSRPDKHDEYESSGSNVRMVDPTTTDSVV